MQVDYDLLRKAPAFYDTGVMLSLANPMNASEYPPLENRRAAAQAYLELTACRDQYETNGVDDVVFDMNKGVVRAAAARCRMLTRFLRFAVCSLRHH